MLNQSERDQIIDRLISNPKDSEIKIAKALHRSSKTVLRVKLALYEKALRKARYCGLHAVPFRNGECVVCAAEADGL